MTVGDRPADGYAYARFAAGEWGMLAGTAVTWGGSFLFMDIGLEHFAPPLIAFGRIALGAATLALLPAAREPVPRSEWPQIALLGITWMAVPFLLLAIAQQWIDTGLAGMINATAPLFTALVGALFVRSLPSRLQGIGLVLGFLGVVAISLPSVEGGSNLAGVLLVLSAAVLYGFAFNIAAPLQARLGSLAVTWRAMLVAAAALLPAAVAGALQSSFGWWSLLAVVALGSLGTGLAFVWFTTLIGRVGPSRAAVSIYFVPVVAVALGAVFLDERAHVAALLGTAMVLGGAYLTSRARKPSPAPPSPTAHPESAAPPARGG
jgi:drug/metabolite transporter (DMT)-like permease